ncbi:hypothetical protein O9G_004009 [Rozella allomycis CSF55]|uniref:RING-type domain-containing protein n=1 Tax=Rozella allomycis (strain CSF55) TaxID=988480 RepID=A0A075B1V8_ROZAC|nr:hypothetical protein O9G_004009 [Rozella allomycis CSF55]|eukprot:EPZ36350.1 hypothetical protein O9G_004009 [Rozella allomycis CSF55]
MQGLQTIAITWLVVNQTEINAGKYIQEICIGLSKELIEQLQSRDFECDDYEFLKRLEEMNDYSVLQRLKPKRLMDFFPKQNIEKTCELCSKMIMRINFACRLDCSHIFHQACIEKYVIENGPRCPQDGNQILEEKVVRKRIKKVNENVAIQSAVNEDSLISMMGLLTTRSLSCPGSMEQPKLKNNPGQIQTKRVQNKDNVNHPISMTELWLQGNKLHC